MKKKKTTTTTTTIPLFRPSYGPEELEAVREVLASGWAGLGPRTRAFEEAFAAYVGVPHAVATNSCTAALHLALTALGAEGGEVITPSLTFVATSHAVLYAGAVPVFADVEEETLTIDPVEVERLLTPRTRAVVVMHYGGHPADVDRIRLAVAARGVPLVEDAAHACGASHGGRKVGSLGDVACFSFHAVKNLATGEGGMLTFADARLDARLRRLRWMGIDRGTYERAADRRGYTWSYEVEELGFKYHMNDLPAAIGLAQLGKLDALNARRRVIAATYDTAFEDLALVRTPRVRPGVEHARHNYVVRVPEALRDALIEDLGGRGIAAGVHYRPNHLLGLYRPWRRPLPVTDRVWRTLVTLPLFPDMTEEDVGRVVEAVAAFDRRHRSAATRRAAEERAGSILGG